MLATLDYAVLAIYLLVVIAVCVRVSRRSPDSDELFLAGRTLGAGVVGLSLFASNISSTTLIGLPGAAWQSGIAVANYEWMAALVLVFTAVFVAPTLLGNRITTLPELLERRFDARMRKYLSGVSVFLSIVLDTAGSLFAGALVLQVFFPGLPLGGTIAAIAVFAGLYTAAGGLRAVVYTDVLQSVVLLAGSAILAWLVFAEFDFSWAAVKAAVPEDHLSLIRPLDDPHLPWLGTLIGLPILGFYYWTMNQYVSQRLLGARDMKAAGGGALLAAIMSSVDSALNSASTLITLDFVQPRRPGMDTRALARLGRWITLALMALAALWAPMIDSFPGLFSYLQQAFAYVTPPLVAVFALAFLDKGLGPRAALYATASGHALSAGWFVATQLGWLDLHFTIVAGLLFAATLVFAFAWRRVTGERPAPAALAVVDQAAASASPGWLRPAALAMTLATAALVLAFW